MVMGARRIRVYVAGPITNGDIKKNVEQAVNAGIALIRAGFSPLVPHCTCCCDTPSPKPSPFGIPSEIWYEVDLAWAIQADCILRLPGESVGSDLEEEYAKKHNIPVFYNLEDLIKTYPGGKVIDGELPGHPGYLQLLDNMKTLHSAKTSDYGTNEDRFSNMRVAEEIGIPAWKGALLRFLDKVSRIKTYCKKESLTNECVEDTLLDAASYALIALTLFNEAKND